jgi:hypothetical protein
MRKFWVAWLFLLGLSACTTAPVLRPASDRPFQFSADSFAFNNDLVWDYHFDKETGAIRTVRRDPKPDYTHRCFVVARSARQFFQFAKFDASRPSLTDDGYRRLIEAVIAHDPSETDSFARVVIPGFVDLRSFSNKKEALLKQVLGGAEMSFLQRGNWRMVFPFWRGHQEETAQNLLAEVRVHRPPVVHLATFPRETINHAVLVYDAIENAKEIRFKVYDPNNKDQPTTLTYDRASSTFYFPPSAYFMGGRVDAYEVYNSLVY